jgi:ubiquinone biosynthesis O-methyltransferase
MIKSSTKISNKLFSSVIDRELIKFSSIGKKWWDSTSSDGASPLHAMNPTRVHYIRKCMAKKLSVEHLPPNVHLKNTKFLDVGCGGGLLAESLARLGADVTAIDPSRESIDVATVHSKKDPKTSSISYQEDTIGMK